MVDGSRECSISPSLIVPGACAASKISTLTADWLKTTSNSHELDSGRSGFSPRFEVPPSVLVGGRADASNWKSLSPNGCYSR